MSAEKYYVSDGNGGKEVPIPVREDPYKAILAKPEAKKSEEKPQNEVQPPLTAGDVVAKEYKDSFAGKEEAVVSTPEKELVYGHCNNCRLELTEDKVVKTAIDYQRNEDGTLSKAASRFSIFCKNCMKFVTIIDRDAAKMLQDMIRKNGR